MKIAIITSVSGESSRELANALLTRSQGIVKKADVFKPFNDGRTDFLDYDYVFSYGCSQETLHKKRFNSAKAVATCVSKPKTFDAFNRAGVSTVPYTTLKQGIPKDWPTVVIRKKADGRKAEDLFFANQIDGEEIPDGELFTRHFDHKYEYRITVVAGVVVGRYYKHDVGGDWYFNNQPAKGFEKMDDHCLRAARALDIDYVGFDVVAMNKNNFAILEANSGPRLTDEAETAIVQFFMDKA